MANGQKSSSTVAGDDDEGSVGSRALGKFGLFHGKGGVALARKGFVTLTAAHARAAIFATAAAGGDGGGE